MSILEVKIDLYYILIVIGLGHLIFDFFKVDATGWKKNVIIFAIATSVSFMKLLFDYIQGYGIAELVASAENNFLSYLLAVGFYASFSKYLVTTVGKLTGEKKDDRNVD